MLMCCTCMQAGHVYICDLKIMDGLTARDGCYNVAPLLLLYVNSSNQLVPIAIQLQQQPGDNNPIFLPTDHWLDWLLAKMYYRLAHGQVTLSIAISLQDYNHFLSNSSITSWLPTTSLAMQPWEYTLWPQGETYQILIPSSSSLFLISATPLPSTQEQLKLS